MSSNLTCAHDLAELKKASEGEAGNVWGPPCPSGWIECFLIPYPATGLLPFYPQQLVQLHVWLMHTQTLSHVMELNERCGSCVVVGIEWNEVMCTGHVLTWASPLVVALVLVFQTAVSQDIWGGYYGDIMMKTHCQYSEWLYVLKSKFYFECGRSFI